LWVDIATKSKGNYAALRKAAWYLKVTKWRRSDDLRHRFLPSNLDPITHGHCPQGNSVSALLGSDVLPVLSTAFTMNVFSHSAEA
jgi:hypothetical protein